MCDDELDEGTNPAAIDRAFKTEIEQLIASKQRETPDTLNELRERCPWPADRVDGAVKLKADANERFAANETQTALRLYLTGIWLLKPDDPPVPPALNARELPTGAALLPTLGGDSNAVSKADGPEGKPVEPATDAAAADHTRRALHLNVAACALRLDDWPLGRAACDFVLGCDPLNIKALLRLAKCHEGEGDLSAAISTLSGRLLKIEPDNREALGMLNALRKRSIREKKMFGGMFTRAVGKGGDADGLYSDAALREERRYKEAEHDRLMKLENLAKLPPDMWAEELGKLKPEKLNCMKDEGVEMSHDMPNTAWVKHMANLSPGALEQTQKVRKILDAQRAAKDGPAKDGPAESGHADEREEEEETPIEALEDWLDAWLTPVAFMLALAAIVVAVCMRFYASFRE